MALLKTKMFKTIHPMTYMYVVQSMILGFMVFLESIGFLMFFNVDDFFWPEQITYVWSLAIVLFGLGLLIAFFRDSGAKRRKLFFIMAKLNFVAWIFAATVWFLLESWLMLFISIWFIIVFTYIALSSQFTSRYKRT